MRQQKGFTLVELLAVMAIIGILAAVVSGAVSGLGAAGVTAQILSDTNTIATAADRFLNDSFNPTKYPVEPLPPDQTDLGVRAIDFDARLPNDPNRTFTPDYLKDIPDSAALVSYRIETATGNVFFAADGADFAPPSGSRLNVTQTDKSPSAATEIIFDLTMRKNRAATEILKVQIPAGYAIGGQSLASGVPVGKLTISFATDTPATRPPRSHNAESMLPSSRSDMPRCCAIQFQSNSRSHGSCPTSSGLISVSTSGAVAP
ncbi:MAG: type II secretion system protein [Chloroflexi bacterium]|nr:type II secretion system protein [Chloroflexota bacterium]